MTAHRQTRAGSKRAALERPVETVPGACAFSDDPEAADPVWLLRELKKHPQFLVPLKAKAQEYEHENVGRDREEGDYGLLYLAYVFVGETRLQRFMTRWQSSDIWKEAGFTTTWRPSYNTVWLHFDELERQGFAEAMREAGNLVVQKAKQHDDAIGRDISTDATSYQAHARLKHCCPDDDEVCEALPGVAEVLSVSDDSTVEARRHKDAQQPPEDVHGGELDNRLRKLPANDPRRELLPEGPRYYLQNGHVFRSLDATAGGRMYEDKEFWLGGLLMAAADVRRGPPVALNPIAADEAEASHYELLMERVRDATGSYPDRVSGDRGYSTKDVFAFNTQRGIASVFPWRRSRSGPKERADVDCDEFDRHGIPRCRHCGGPGELDGAGLGFHLPGDKPVLRFRCRLSLTPACKGEQQISCLVEPRMLLPLSRLTEQYNALRVTGKTMERVWRHWRDRYNIAGKNLESRTFRRQSLLCQELRGETARLIEWFRVLLREGWLGSTRRSADVAPVVRSGKKRLASILSARDRHAVDIPYGKYAVAAGFARGPDPPGS